MIKKTFLLIAFVFSFSPLFLRAQSLPVFDLRSGVFITDWLVCGPFAAHGNASIYTDYLTAAGGETAVVPAAGRRVSSDDAPGGAAVWRLATAGGDGRLDLRRLLTPNQDDVAYAAVTVRCDHRTPALLLLGSNDMAAVWLNGQRVWVYPDPRASGPDADRVAVTLGKGDNLLLVKVQNVGGGWWLYARFAELHPLDSNIFTTAPQAGTVPMRLSDGTLADIFSVMLYNISARPAGPVTMRLDDDETVIARQTTLAPGALAWLRGTVAMPRDTTAGTSPHTLVLQSPGGRRSFPLTVERLPLADGVTRFVQGFHVDPVWRDSQSGYQALSFSNLRQFLRAAQGDSGFAFVVSEIPYLKPYYDSHPADRALLRRLTGEGRVETCGSYNQPNETTVAGEALIRNILYGRLFHENVLHDSPRVYQPWDVFGHILQLPQILAATEFTGAVWTRSNYRSPSVRVPGLPDLYFAQAPDGTTLPVRKVDYGFPNAGGTAAEAETETRRRIAEDMHEQQRQIPGIRNDLRLNATDEKAPTLWMVGRSQVFGTFVPTVTLDADGAEKYFRDIQRQYRQDHLAIPTVTRDVSQYNEGCELSRQDLKSGNRLGENTLLTAEKFSVVAGILGMPYPAEALDAAWRQLLYGQHHDGITGCGADEPYLDLVLGYHQALALADSSLAAALRYLEKKIDTRHANAGAVPVTVFNPLNWSRHGVVTVTVHFDRPLRGFRLVDDRGRKVPLQRDHLERKGRAVRAATITFVADTVPSLGYRTWWVVPDKTLPPPAREVPAERYRIENEYFRITADADAGGALTSVWDKRHLKEYLSTEKSALGNELLLLKEGPGFEPAWRFLTTGKKFFSSDYPATIHLYRSPVCERMVITGEMPRMAKRVQEVILWKGIDRIDFRTRLTDYRGEEGKNIPENDTTSLRDDRDLFVVTFPPNLKGDVPVLEDRFTTKVYFRGREPFSYSSTATAWTTHHSMNSCYQWLDQSWSVKISFGGRYSVAPGPAEVVTPRDTLLRRAGYRLQQALAQRGIPATPAGPGVQRSYDIQYRRFSFSAGPLGGNSYNDSLMQRLREADRRAIRRQLQQQGYAYAFVYDKGLPGAWFDYPVLMIVGRDVRTTRLALDNVTRQLRRGREIHLPLEAYLAGGKAWVEDYGLALLNRGNIAVGTEPDGTMTLALMHTIPWQSPLLDWTHDFPERKTHLYEYALQPHKGNWQDAATVYAGYEYNNPLRAVQGTQHGGTLPPRHAFLETGGRRAVVTALKAVSAGREAFAATKKTAPAEGIVLRLYEPEGREDTVTVTTAFPLRSLQLVNMMERRGTAAEHAEHSFAIAMKPYTILTCRLTTDVQPSAAGGYTPAGGAPLYCRYWEHNDGAAPAGYLPVNVRVTAPAAYDREEGRNNIRQVTVWVTNDLTDTVAAGTVTVTTPPGVRAVPAAFPYRVEANSEKSYPVTLVLEGEIPPGFIRADIMWEGRQYYDVLPFRLPAKRFGHADSRDDGRPRLRWSITSDSSRVTVTLTNPLHQAVDGEVALAGPAETWGDCPSDNVALVAVVPWRRSFHLEPDETRTLTFGIRQLPGRKDRHYWLAARLSWYGYLEYKPAVGKLGIVER